MKNENEQVATPACKCGHGQEWHKCSFCECQEFEGKAEASASSESLGEAPKRAHELEWAVHPNWPCTIVPIDDVHKPLGGSIDEADDLKRYARVIATVHYHQLSKYAHKPTEAEAKAVTAQIVANHNASTNLEAKQKWANGDYIIWKSDYDALMAQHDALYAFAEMVRNNCHAENCDRITECDCFYASEARVVLRSAKEQK